MSLVQFYIPKHHIQNWYIALLTLYMQFPHDSNLTLTMIINVLVDFAKTNRFPEVLYIQMDNTCRENKNKYVLTFCAALVHLQIFKKVSIPFLHNYKLSFINFYLRFRLIFCQSGTLMRTLTKCFLRCLIRSAEILPIPLRRISSKLGAILFTKLRDHLFKGGFTMGDA